MVLINSEAHYAQDATKLIPYILKKRKIWFFLSTKFKWFGVDQLDVHDTQDATKSIASSK